MLNVAIQDDNSFSSRKESYIHYAFAFLLLEISIYSMLASVFTIETDREVSFHFEANVLQIEKCNIGECFSIN